MCEIHGLRASGTTKPEDQAGGVCGNRLDRGVLWCRRSSGHVFHTSRQAMIETYNVVCGFVWDVNTHPYLTHNDGLLVDLKFWGPRNVLSYDFFCWFISLRGPRTISAWLPLCNLWAIFVICINPRWPPADQTENQFWIHLSENDV